MFITTQDNVNLFYKDWGSGKPIVLIHGWPLNSDMWEYQATKLAKTNRVITYDRRGFGRSNHPAKGQNYDTFADDLASIINSLNLKDVTLVGFSMGGGEIARYLTRHGDEKIERAMLVSTVVPYMLKTNDNPDGVDQIVFDEMKTSLMEDRPQFLQNFAKDFYGLDSNDSAVSDAQLNWTSFMALQASPLATIESVDAFSQTDFREDLKSFKIPTMIIHGIEDKTVPIEPTGEAAKDGIMEASFKFYDGAPHGLFLTHKDYLYKDIYNFVNG